MASSTTTDLYNTTTAPIISGEITREAGATLGLDLPTPDPDIPQPYFPLPEAAGNDSEQRVEQGDEERDETTIPQGNFIEKYLTSS